MPSTIDPGSGMVIGLTRDGESTPRKKSGRAWNAQRLHGRIFNDTAQPTISIVHDRPRRLR